MKDILLVIDMQNDFIDGSLGTKEAETILPEVIKEIEGFNGDIFFTRDTHDENYLDTLEGSRLPIPHCIKNTNGWEIHKSLKKYIKEENILNKKSFGSVDLAKKISKINEAQGVRSITLVGLCTDICIISNALLLKAYMPEVTIKVKKNACAGVSPESHLRALQTMQVCQIEII